MINLEKSLDFFDPSRDTSKIHIVGCGSVGSTVAENLARCGVTNFILWDFDEVEPHNIANQMFVQKHVGMKKVDALEEILRDINPDVSVKKNPAGWQGEMMSGYIFLCVDSIDLRRQIVEQHMDNEYVKAVFDFRTMLTGAYHYAADWSDTRGKSDLLKSMQYTSEESKDSVQLSACGVVLGVATTVRVISAFGVNNYINFLKGEGIRKFITADVFDFDVIAV